MERHGLITCRLAAPEHVQDMPVSRAQGLPFATVVLGRIVSDYVKMKVQESGLPWSSSRRLAILKKKKGSRASPGRYSLAVGDIEATGKLGTKACIITDTDSLSPAASEIIRRQIQSSSSSVDCSADSVHDALGKRFIRIRFNPSPIVSLRVIDHSPGLRALGTRDSPGE